jgi:hypothetical protein
MRNHAHLVVGVPGDPDPADLLRDFKGYGSRALNKKWCKPTSGTWWTESGSRRKKPKGPALVAALAYVRDQRHALVVWLSDAAKAALKESAVERGERGA